MFILSLFLKYKHDLRVYLFTMFLSLVKVYMYPDAIQLDLLWHIGLVTGLAMEKEKRERERALTLRPSREIKKRLVITPAHKSSIQ